MCITSWTEAVTRRKAEVGTGMGQRVRKISTGVSAEYITDLGKEIVLDFLGDGQFDALRQLSLEDRFVLWHRRVLEDSLQAISPS